jgi:hypothetical protein
MGTEGPFAWFALFFLGLALIVGVGVPLYGAALIVREWLKK